MTDIKIIRNDTSSHRRMRLLTKGLVTVLVQVIIGVVMIFFGIAIYLKLDKSYDITNIIMSLKSASKLKSIAMSWRDVVRDNFYCFLIGFCILYIILQSFAIPGTSIMNALAGYFYNDSLIITGFVGCICASIGSSFCYLLSWYLGKRYTIKMASSDRIEKWRMTIQRHRNHMFFYFVFLRVTPIIPNWFINIASPHLDVSWYVFFFGTFVGVMPMTWIQIQAGIMLEEWASDTLSIWNSQNILLVALAALLTLLPPLTSQIISRKDSNK